MFEVTPEDIERLKDRQLVDMLKRLLLIEARLHSIPASEVHVPLNITVADGGEDGRICVNGVVKNDDFLMQGQTLFQVKATNMTPADCKKELCKKGKRELKRQVAQILNAGGNYILFYGRMLVQQGIQDRIWQFKLAVEECGYTFNMDKFRIYDANIIHSWVNKHLSVIVACYEYLGKPIPNAARTYDDWSKEGDFNRPYHVCEILHAEFVQYIKNFVSNKAANILRVFGERGCGKTHFVFNCFKQQPHQSIVYIDANEFEKNNLTADIQAWARQGITGILIIDNCSEEVHAQLLKISNRSDCKLKFITIGIHPIGGKQCGFQFNLTQAIEIDKVIAVNFTDYSRQDIDLIEEMAFKNVKLALDIAESINTQSMHELSRETIGRYATIAKIVLFKDQQINMEELAVFQAIALFERVGISKVEEEHYKFVAKVILSQAPDKMHEIIQRYLLIKQYQYLVHKDDCIVITLEPFQLILAAMWWNECSPDRAKNVIADILESPYTDSFFLTISKLNVLPYIVKRIEDIFANQEVLRLFNLSTPKSLIALKYLAEIIPDIVLTIVKNLRKEINETPVQNEILIEDILVNLCKQESTFLPAVIVLLENADIVVNNGIYCETFSFKFLKSLFGTGGAPTFTSYEKRLEVLRMLVLGNYDPNLMLPYLLTQIADTIASVSKDAKKGKLTLGGKKAKYPPGSIVEYLEVPQDAWVKKNYQENQLYCKRVLLLLLEVYENNKSIFLQRLLKGLFYRHIYTLPDTSRIILQKVMFEQYDGIVKFLELAKKYIADLVFNANHQPDFIQRWEAHLEYCQNNINVLGQIISKRKHASRQAITELGIDEYLNVERFNIPEILLDYNCLHRFSGAIEVSYTLAGEDDRPIESSAEALFRSRDNHGFFNIDMSNLLNAELSQAQPYLAKIFKNKYRKQMDTYECIGTTTHDIICTKLYYENVIKMRKSAPHLYNTPVTVFKFKQQAEVNLLLSEKTQNFDNKIKCLISVVKSASEGLKLAKQLSLNTDLCMDLIENIFHCYDMLGKIYFSHFESLSPANGNNCTPELDAMLNEKLDNSIKYYKLTLKYINMLEEPRKEKHTLFAAQLFHELGVCHYTRNNPAVDIEIILHCHKKSLELREKLLGNNHIDLAPTLANLARTYESDNNFEEALKWYDRAYQIRYSVLGENHPLTLKLKLAIDNLNEKNSDQTCSSMDKSF